MYVKCNCNGESCKINIAQTGMASGLGVCPFFTGEGACHNFALQLLNHHVCQ